MGVPRRESTAVANGGGELLSLLHDDDCVRTEPPGSSSRKCDNSSPANRRSSRVQVTKDDVGVARPAIYVSWNNVLHGNEAAGLGRPILLQTRVRCEIGSCTTGKNGSCDAKHRELLNGLHRFRNPNRVSLLSWKSTLTLNVQTAWRQIQKRGRQGEKPFLSYSQHQKLRDAGFEPATSCV